MVKVMPKELRQFLTFLVFVVSSMTYSRATIDELPDTAQDAYWLYIFGLAILAGCCESIEVYDHLFPAQYDESNDAHEEQKQQSLLQPAKTSDIIVMSTGLMLLAPPLAMCGWAHRLQGSLLASSLGLHDNEFLGLVFAAPALIKFCAISVPHLFHTLNGTREHYSLSVTNSQVIGRPQSSWPPLKWWLMLAAMVYLHLPEGQLIAAPINQEFSRRIAVFGFAIAESVPHLNQMEQLPNNIANMLRHGDSSSIILSLSVGALAGVAHASQALLAAIANGVDYTAWLGPLIEFVIGFSEAQQHAVPAARRLYRSTFFNSRSPIEIEASASMQTENAINTDIPRLA